MVTTFAVLLSIIFILEVAAGALGLAYRKKVYIVKTIYNPYCPSHLVQPVT